MENKIAIYQSEDGLVKIDVHLEDDSVWLNQAQIVSLYQSSKANVSEHIKHIFEEGELGKNSAVRKIRTTAKDHSFKSSLGTIYDCPVKTSRKRNNV
jgi:hypothetical protein